MKLYRRVRDFFLHGIWRRRISRERRPVRYGFYLLRAMVLVIRGVLGHRTSVYASSLTYLTLISVVPFAVLVLGIAARLGIPGQLAEAFTVGLPEAHQDLISGAAKAFEEQAFAPVALLGAPILIYSVVLVLVRIEMAFHEIWGVKRDRPMLRRYGVFAAVVVFAPALLAAATALTGAVTSSAFGEWLLSVPDARKFVGVVARLLPLVIAVGALTLLYWLVPYTHVRLRSAMVGGFVAGALSQLLGLGFFQAQFGASRLGLVYGQLAAIPIFLVYVYVNWMIFLFGAEISYGAQHVKTWLVPGEEEEVADGPAVEDAALRVVLWLGQREGAYEPEAIGEGLHAPARLVSRILGTLAEQGVVEEEGETEHYRLARSTDEISAEEVVAPFSGHELVQRPGPEEPDEQFVAVRILRDQSRAPYRTPLSTLYAPPGAEPSAS